MAGLLLVGGLGLRVACCEVNGVSVGSSRGGPLRRTKVVVKVRRAMAAGAARLAAAMAERWTNMARAIGVEWRGGRGRLAGA